MRRRLPISRQRVSYKPYFKVGLDLARNGSDMTKSELIEKISDKQNHLLYGDVEACVKALLEQMSKALACGDRIEIRGFGSFSVHTQSPRTGRNPRTGESETVPAKLTLHFKPGKELRERVNTLGNIIEPRKHAPPANP